MEREKMIEEMAKDIHNAKRASDYHCYEDEYTDCKKCKLLKYAENKMCQDAYEACWLIDDGYQKVPDGALILTKEEYERLKKEELYAQGKYNLCHGNRSLEAIAKTTEQTGQILIDYDRRIRKAYDEIIPKLLEENKQVRKETAREIFDYVKERYKDSEKTSKDFLRQKDEIGRYIYKGGAALLYSLGEWIKKKYGVGV